MRITITSHAQKQIKKYPKTFQIIVINKIRSFSSEEPRNAEKLTGYKNYFRIRLGNFRIVYIKSSDEIEILLVAHRKEVYKLLERIIK
jgi:mRNA interferase RelE/StbE